MSTLICINASRHTLIPVVGWKIKFCAPDQSEKQKLAEAWYQDLLKFFKTLLKRSLGFIHILKHALKFGNIN